MFPTNKNRTICVASPAPGTGKSAIAAYLAVFLSQRHKTALIVDANQENPTVSKFFDGDGVEHFYQDILEVGSAKSNIKSAVYSTKYANLDFIASKKTSAKNNTYLQLLNLSKYFSDLGKYRFVIFDTNSKMFGALPGEKHPEFLIVITPTTLSQCDTLTIEKRFHNITPQPEIVLNMLEKSEQVLISAESRMLFNGNILTRIKKMEEVSNLTGSKRLSGSEYAKSFSEGINQIADYYTKA